MFLALALARRQPTIEVRSMNAQRTSYVLVKVAAIVRSVEVDSRPSQLRP